MKFIHSLAAALVISLLSPAAFAVDPASIPSETQTNTVCPISGMPKLHHRASKDSGYVRPGLKISVPKLKIGVDKD